MPVEFTPISVDAKGATHIVLYWPSQNSEVMFRASDGMYVGERAGTCVYYGEDPNAPPSDPKRRRSRVFMNDDGKIPDPMRDESFFHWNDMASRWLRTAAAKNDLTINGIEAEPVIHEHCMEGLVLNSAQMEMLANGAQTSPVSIKGFSKKAN